MLRLLPLFFVSVLYAQQAVRFTGAPDTTPINVATPSSAAPVGATYITQTANGTLTNEQALAALSTGILKSTTTTGVLSIATGADIPAAGSTTQLQYNNSGVLGGMSGTEWTDASRLLVFKDAGDNNLLSISVDPAGDINCGAVLYVNCDGVSPSSVSGATGTPGAVVEFDVPGGGSTTVATTGTGGAGGSFIVNGGFGGVAGSAATSSTGGGGGSLNLTSGTGGSASVSGSMNTGGAGGNVILRSASGGAAQGGGGATNSSGDTGDILLIAPIGRLASGGATNNGGDAGDVRVLLNIGGTGSTTSGADGRFAVNAADGDTLGSDVFTVTRAGLATSIAYATGSNCSDSAGDAACGSASAGSVVVDAGDTTTVVSTTAITANSQIFLFVDASLGTRLSVTCNTTPVVPYISARIAATSFTITVTAGPVTNPACLNYLIIN